MDQHLDVGQVTGQITMAGNEAHAQRGGHRLGKAADVERAAQLVQRGDTRRGSRLEVGEGIVLHDQGIVAIGQLQDLVRLVRRGVRGRGIVRQRLGEEQRRLAGQLQFAFQGLDIRPVRMARDADDARAGQLEFAVQHVVARFIDQHAIAGADEIANHDIERLVGPVGQHDLAGGGLDAMLCQLLHQVLAQRQVTEAAAVAEQRTHAGAHHLLVEFVQPHIVQPFHRREAIAQTQMAGVVLQLLAHEPDHVHGAAQAALLFFLRARRRGADEEAGAAPGLDHALRRQFLEHVDDGVLGTAMPGGQLADRRQPAAGSMGTLCDLAADQLHQGLGECLGDGHG